MQEMWNSPSKGPLGKKKEWIYPSYGQHDRPNGAKNASRGYQNTQNFMTIIYLRLGQLPLTYPLEIAETQISHLRLPVFCHHNPDARLIPDYFTLDTFDTCSLGKGLFKSLNRFGRRIR